MVTINTTYRRLAEIAAHSEGYSVDAIESGKVYSLSSIAFDVTASGRKNRAVVVCLCNGKPARFNSDDTTQIRD